MEISRWDLIKKAHDSCVPGAQKEAQWHHLFLELMSDLDGFLLCINDSHKSKSIPPNREQLLVLLTFYANALRSFQLDKLFKEELPLPRLSKSLVQIILGCDDSHVYTIASKCLCLCLASTHVDKVNSSWYAETVRPCISSLRSGAHVGRILDFFRCVFSKQFARIPTETQVVNLDVNEKFRLWALQELIRLWRPLAEDIINRYIIDAPLINQEHPIVFSLLSLWSKLIKNHQKYMAGDDIPFSEEEDPFARLQEATCILVDVLSCHETVPCIFDKICDVLNRTLPYGSGSDQFQYGTGQGHGLQVDLAADVLRGVQRGFLEKVPLNSGVRHFGGFYTLSDGNCIGEAATHNAQPSRMGESAKLELNLRSFRKITMLVTKACTLITRSAAYAGITLSAVELVLDTLWSWARDACPQGDRRHWIIMVFGDQDDMLVEILLCFLDIHTTIKWKPTETSQVENTCQNGVSPHELFLHFLHHTSFDHTLLLDLLTSPETCFLLYFVRYLHYVHSSWSELNDFCLTWNKILLEEEDTLLHKRDASVTPLSGRHSPSESQQTITSNKSRNEDSSGGLSIDCTQNEPFTHNPEKADSAQSSTVSPNTMAQEMNYGCASISSLKIVEYSDDSVSSDSDTEEFSKGKSAVPLASNFAASHDLHSPLEVQPEADTLNSTKSDLQSSPTGSCTSLTSVTSELDMPSDLQDAGMETDAEDGILDRMMSVLIRLRLVIDRLDDKGLFPYNALALQRILSQTEALYEGEEP